MKPILVWDFDGVIFDSFESVYALTNKVFGSFGIDFTREGFADLYDGNGWQALEAKGVTREMKEAYSRTEALYNSQEANNRFFPGMKEVVQQLAVSYDSFVVSNNMTEVVERGLRILGVRDAFFHVGGREEGGLKVERIKRVLGPLGQVPEGLWFITDTVGDIKEGKELNMKTLAVTWGYHKKARLEKIAPDQLIDEPSQMLEILLAN